MDGVDARPKRPGRWASTRAFRREARLARGYSWLDWLHGYAYGRWPYVYISIGTGTHPLSRWLAPFVAWLGRLLPSRRPASAEQVTFADSYHGKVVPLEHARQLVSVKEDVTLHNLEQIIPFAAARDIVLRNPGHIVALDCPCRAARANPCLPLDVCLVIGEPFASFVLAHHPRRSRWVTQEEAAAILQAEDERGHVHHAFFKDAMLGRFYAICNCCACCCGAIQAWRRGTPMLASSGYICQVDATLCQDCGQCEDACQFGALSRNDGTLRVDTCLCMGCGVCTSVCPESALSLRLDPGKGTPLVIRELVRNAGIGVTPQRLGE